MSRMYFDIEFNRIEKSESELDFFHPEYFAFETEDGLIISISAAEIDFSGEDMNYGGRYKDLECCFDYDEDEYDPDTETENLAFNYYPIEDAHIEYLTKTKLYEVGFRGAKDADIKKVKLTLYYEDKVLNYETDNVDAVCE